MIEMEVYTAGLHALNKILELDDRLEAIAGLRYKADSNLDLDESTISLCETRAIFLKLGLNRRFISSIPSTLRPKTTTKLLTV
jgi:hypothetical protein